MHITFMLVCKQVLTVNKFILWITNRPFFIYNNIYHYGNEKVFRKEKVFIQKENEVFIEKEGTEGVHILKR